MGRWAFDDTAPGSRCLGGAGRMGLWRFLRICAGLGCLRLACGLFPVDILFFKGLKGGGGGRPWTKCGEVRV